MPSKSLDFHKGLNTAADHMSCPDGYAITLTDWKLEYGYMRPRYGFTVVNSASLIATNQVNLIAFYFDVNNAPSTNVGSVIVATNSKIYQAIYSTDAIWKVANNVVFTDITGTATAPIGPATWDILNNVLIVLGSGAGAQTQITAYNTNAAPLAGTPPAGVIVKVVNNFAFISGTRWAGGTGASFSNVYWSNVGDPQTWSAANFLSYRTSDGDFVTALGSVNQDLLIFKNNHIGRLSTQTSVVAGAVTLGPLYTLIDGIGCPSPGCVDTLPDGRVIFFGSDYNLWQTDGVSVKLLSKNPYPGTDVWRGSGLGNLFVKGQGSNVNITVKVFPPQNEIWIAIPVQDFVSPKTYTFIYDYVQDYWRQGTGYDISCLCVLPQYRQLLNTELNVPTHRLLAGNSVFGGQNGSIYFLENENQTTTNDYLGATVPAVMTLTAPAPEALADEDFRSLIALSSNSGSTSVFFGFDGTLNSSPTAALSSTYVRNVIKIPYLSQASSVRYASLQVSFKDSTATNKIYPPFLSTEISS